MALIRRKDARKNDSAAAPPPSTGAASRVQIKIEGPDAERLAALLDMSAVVERLREQGVDPDERPETADHGTDAGRDRSGSPPTADQDPEARQ
jgi:hypothetical protein